LSYLTKELSFLINQYVYIGRVVVKQERDEREYVKKIIRERDKRRRED